jgi:hypothetical protein
MSTAVRDLRAEMAVRDSIRGERRRQADLIDAGTIPWDCASPDVPDVEKLPVLLEEVGEVARALLTGITTPADRAHLRDELIQAAAVAAAWAQALSDPS